MKLLSEFVNQADLKKSDGSDAGKNDLDSKGAEVKFDLMRNTINSNGKITGSDVANYLEKAQDLNDEVDTVLYGLETDDGQVVKVYVNATQADAFEQEMKTMLGVEDDIEEAVNRLASKFDIVDVIWPKGEGEEGEGEGLPDDDVNLDDAADLGNTMDDDEDDEMEVIASVDDEAAAAVPPDDEGEEEGASDEEPAPKKKKKGAEGEEGSEEEGENEAEGESESESGEDEEAEHKDKKKKKSGDKHSLLKDIGGGLAGKKKEAVAEGEVIPAQFGKGVDNQGIEIPQGYERFELDGRVIVGYKDGKKRVISTVSDPKLGQELVRIYNGGKASTTVKPMSMLQAFGSHGLNILHDIGIKLMEKPSYWEDLDNDPKVDEVALQRAKAAFKKHGMGLPEFTTQELYGKEPRGPMASIAHKPAVTTFIVTRGNGRRYLADTTGANTYIRMWAGIQPTADETADEETKETP